MREQIISQQQTGPNMQLSMVYANSPSHAPSHTHWLQHQSVSTHTKIGYNPGIALSLPETSTIATLDSSPTFPFPYGGCALSDRPPNDTEVALCEVQGNYTDFFRYLQSPLPKLPPSPFEMFSVGPSAGPSAGKIRNLPTLSEEAVSSRAPSGFTGTADRAAGDQIADRYSEARGASGVAAYATTTILPSSNSLGVGVGPKELENRARTSSFGGLGLALNE